MGLFKKAIAECVGTMVLVIVGCGVAVTTGCEGNAGIIATSLAFGLSIVAMAYSIGNVSGCHINPAVSLGFLVAKKMTVKDFVVYVAAQIVGALIGALVLFAIFQGGDFANSGLGANMAQAGIGGYHVEGATVYEATTASLFIALASEIILSFIFVLAILGVTSKSENGHVAGIVIGLVLTLVHLLGIRLTGTSVNPARSIGPALIALANGVTEPAKELWIFIIGPFAGAALAGLVFNLLIAPKQAKAEASVESK